MYTHFSLLFATTLFYVCLSENCNYAERSSGKYLLCAGSINTVDIGQNTSLSLYTNPPYNSSDELVLNITVNDTSIVRLPHQVVIVDNNTVNIILHALRAGKTSVHFHYTENYSNNTEPITQLYKVVRNVSIRHSHPLDIIIAIIGWLYFVAWSISFYPQIFLNFWRRSVVGLNFDFLAFNITGFVAYSFFNVGLYWIPEIQREYFDLHPSGVNPVQLNDVIFALHAVAATAFTIFQCFIFERGKQRISYVAWIILIALWLTILISLFVSVGHKLSWLNFLYIFSYVKLAVTLIKYVPQAWMNCRRRSTEGWSIGNVLLDFTGGSLSILQMFLLSYNYNDWRSIFGDPTKFGLGAFSIAFDLIFMFQHYVLFRHPPKKEERRKINSKDEKMSDSSEDEEAALLGHEKKNGRIRNLLVMLHLSN